MVSTPLATPPLNPQSAPADLKARLDWGEPALTIVDIRDRSDFNHLRIQGAISIPTIELREGVASLETNRDIYVYADNDSIAASAVEMLAEAGYTRVSQLSGGLAAWKNAGYPVEGVA